MDCDPCQALMWRRKNKGKSSIKKIGTRSRDSARCHHHKQNSSHSDQIGIIGCRAIITNKDICYVHRNTKHWMSCKVVPQNKDFSARILVLHVCVSAQLNECTTKQIV
eukprot:861072_1